MMRARSGIDKTKAWADRAEEEEEADSDEESGNEGSKHASAHSQEGGGDGTLTEGGLPRHASAHGQQGGGDSALTEGGLPCDESAVTDVQRQAVRDALKLQGHEVDEREVQAYVLEALGVELCEEELIPIIDELIDEKNAAAAAAAAATRAARRAEIFAGSMLVDKEQGGLPRHVSAHGQEGDGGGGLTEGGLTIELATSEPADSTHRTFTSPGPDP